MANILIVYDSKYGHTKKYGEMINKYLKTDILPKKKVNQYILTRYQIIIFGGGLYPNGINGINLIIDNYQSIKEKVIVIFTCGITDPNVDENKQKIVNDFKKKVKDDIFNNVKLYNFRGGIDHSKLNIFDKSIMRVINKAIKKKSSDELSSEDKVFLETYDSKIDYINEESIKELVDFIKDEAIRIDKELLNDK